MPRRPITHLEQGPSSLTINHGSGFEDFTIPFLETKHRPFKRRPGAQVAEEYTPTFKFCSYCHRPIAANTHSNFKKCPDCGAVNVYSGSGQEEGGTDGRSERGEGQSDFEGGGELEDGESSDEEGDF